MFIHTSLESIPLKCIHKLKYLWSIVSLLLLGNCHLFWNVGFTFASWSSSWKLNFLLCPGSQFTRDLTEAGTLDDSWLVLTLITFWSFMTLTSLLVLVNLGNVWLFVNDGSGCFRPEFLLCTGIKIGWKCSESGMSNKLSWVSRLFELWSWDWYWGREGGW